MPRWCVCVGGGLMIITHAPPLYADSKATLASRFDPRFYNALTIDDARGSMIGPDGSGGRVVGRVDDAHTRKELLAAQPFVDCPYGCRAWQPYRAAELDAVFAIDDDTIPVTIQRRYAAALRPTSSCVIRNHRQANINDILPTPEVDILCLASDSGEFIYFFGSSQGIIVALWG